MQSWQSQMWIGVCLAALLAGYGVTAQAQQPTSAGRGNPQLTRATGSIKATRGNSITLARDSGADIAITLGDSTKILRVSPGQTDLKAAAPLQVQELQPGDRVVVRGLESGDGRSIEALSVLVMKQSDVSAKQERERTDWQRRGVGGLVSAVDGAAGTITISTGGFGASRQIVIRSSKATVVRRYAPESVRFDDAKPSTMAEIKLGDQLRARGPRSADGNEVNADEIVFGTFRNIAGTISGIDEANNSLSVQDAISKKEVVVKVSPEMQLKKLPPEMAQRIAMRLQGGNGQAGNQPGGGTGQFRHRGEGGVIRSAPRDDSGPPNGAAGAENGAQRGSADLQRFLSRMPNSTLADLQKGDAVMIVSTMGEGSGPVKGIVLLAGVEPILASNAARSNGMLLSPWSLSAPSGEGESAP